MLQHTGLTPDLTTGQIILVGIAAFVYQVATLFAVTVVIFGAL